MREYGVVKVRFWTWAKRMRLSPAARELALYCLTSSHSNSLGCYYLPIAYIADDMATDPATVRQTVSQLTKIGFLEHDEETGWVWIVGYLDHNPIANPNVGKSLVPVIESLPKEIPYLQRLIDALKAHEKRFPLGFIDSMRDRYRNRIGNGTPNHDQTQTHDHDQTHNHEHDQEQDHDQERSPSSPPEAAKAPNDDDLTMPLPLERSQEAEAVRIYNSAANQHGWPKVQMLTDRRRSALKARLAEIGGIEGWQIALSKVQDSSFLMGKTPRSPEHASWRFTFDFLLRPDHMAKIMEDGYADDPRAARRRSTSRSSISAAIAGIDEAGSG